MANTLLDKIIASLSADALKYLFPGLKKEEELKEEIIEINEAGLTDSYGAAYSIEEDNIRYSLADDDESDLLFSKESAPEVEKKEAKKEDSGVRFSISRRELEPLDFDDYIFEEKKKKTLPIPPRPSAPAAKQKSVKKSEPDIHFRVSSTLKKVLPDPKPIDLEPDAKTKAVLDEIDAIQKKYGISIEELEAALAYRVKLSRLRITRHHAIILDDFDHQEVRMDTLTKAVFLLYLKHPEGIRYKDLCDHRRELEDIYMSISGRSDLEGIRKSISDLTDSIMSNSINEKVSKVKKAFKDVIEDRVAKFYYIDGKQGAARSIALDRTLVIWE